MLVRFVPLSNPPEVRLRSRLADYQILGPAGAAGNSWLATPPSRVGSEDPVVVTEVAVPAGEWDSFCQRLMSLATVRSEFLPPLIEVGQSDEDDGPVTWVVRGDGRARTDPGPASDPEATLRRLARAARGAHDLHEAGWVHGDIRPGSILLRGDDTLLEPPVRADAHPRTGTTPAALDTLEPASIWGEGPSRATDIWALGATAHQLLSGRPVHPALATDPIVTAVQRVLIEAPDISPTLPEGVASLIRSCLAADPSDRPATARDLADSFERAAASR